MAYEKLTAMAKKQGHSHLSLEFLVEFKAAVAEWDDLTADGRALFAPVDPEPVSRCGDAYKEF